MCILAFIQTKWISRASTTHLYYPPLLPVIPLLSLFNYNLVYLSKLQNLVAQPTVHFARCFSPSLFTSHSPTPRLLLFQRRKKNGARQQLVSNLKPHPHSFAPCQLSTVMANTHSTTNGASSTTANQATFLQHSTELADLGRERFDYDTAAIGDRDFALHCHQPVIVRSGCAPKGFESQVFAWNTFQYTTEERNDLEELKGDLHEGQLHRQNRAVREGSQPEPTMRGGARWSKGGRRGGGERADNGVPEALCAGRKPVGQAPPLAKGFAEELDKSMFWDEPIV